MMLLFLGGIYRSLTFKTGIYGSFALLNVGHCSSATAALGGLLLDVS
jgi:hypothetical protein